MFQSFLFVILGSLAFIAFSIIGLMLNLLYQNGRNQLSYLDKSTLQPLELSPDCLRTSWCKVAISEFGESCCHLFDYIKTQQGMTPWGTVLDAGTGPHSLDYLLSLDTKAVVAVTGDPKRQSSMQDMFKDKLRSQDEIIVGNWKETKMLEGKVFDVVIADYLLGSLEGFAPYFQDKLFERLKPHVGKKLYVVGAEPLPDRDDNPHAQIIIEIAKLRDACILLTGDRPYREYPLDWVIRNLRKLGYHIQNLAFFETTYNQDFVETQINVAESKLRRFKNKKVAESMQEYIDKIRDRVNRMSWGIKFGTDYVVVATPIDDSKIKKLQKVCKNTLIKSGIE